MIQLCRHILAGNRQCSQPAANRTLFCRHHRGVRTWKRGLRSQISVPTQTYDHGTILVPDRSPQVHPALELEFPEDPAAILTNIYRATSLLIHGHIDRPTANSVTYGMQVCLSALNGKSLFERAAPTPSRSRSAVTDTDPETGITYSDPGCPTSRGDVCSRPVHRVILTPDGDEIAPPVEILEDNEAEPIHHKGCPCMTCAENYRNHPPELHHPDCTCGLCEEQQPALSDQRSVLPSNDVILSEARMAREVEGSAVAVPPESSTNPGAPSLAQPKVGSDEASTADLHPTPCPLNPDPSAGSDTVNSMSCHPERSAAGAQPRDLQFLETGTNPGAPRPESGTWDSCTLNAVRRTPAPRIARAASLLSASTTRDPLNRPWSVAEYTFGDAIRRHEAQYAARAAACLKEGIEPPPYEPFTAGMIPPGAPGYEEDQQMQQHSSQYWAEHFRKQIADRPDILQYLEEEAAESGVSLLPTGVPTDRSSSVGWEQYLEEEARQVAQTTDNSLKPEDRLGSHTSRLSA